VRTNELVQHSSKRTFSSRCLTWRFLHGCSSSPPSAVKIIPRTFLSQSILEKVCFLGLSNGMEELWLPGILRRRMSLHGKPIEVALDFLGCQPGQPLHDAGLKLIDFFLSGNKTWR